jgi:hypothetical protein
LPATKYRGAAKNEGAISHCRHRNVNLSRYTIYELANRVRLTKHQIIAGRFQMARAKLLKTNVTRGLNQRL